MEWGSATLCLRRACSSSCSGGRPQFPITIRSMSLRGQKTMKNNSQHKNDIKNTLSWIFSGRKLALTLLGGTALCWSCHIFGPGKTWLHNCENGQKSLFNSRRVKAPRSHSSHQPNMQLLHFQPICAAAYPVQTFRNDSDFGISGFHFRDSKHCQTEYAAKLSTQWQRTKMLCLRAASESSPKEAERSSFRQGNSAVTGWD